MQCPTKAIILAAGFGTRMLPLSLDIPKPMMPFWCQPILGHILDMLARWGVRDVIINLHHQPGPVLQYVRQRRPDSLRVALSFEPNILGTGGALSRADWFLDTDHFWMINADVVADLDPTPLCRAFAEHRCLAALWLLPDTGPRSVEMKRGIITNFQSSRPGTHGTFTFSGLHLLSPAILHYIPHDSFSSIIRAYSRAIADGERIQGVCLTHSFWADTGTPNSYMKAHKAALEQFRQHRPGRNLVTSDGLRRMALLRRRQVHVQGFVALGDDVVIEAGAQLNCSVVWDGAHIAANAIVENAIIGRCAHVHGRVPGIAVRSDFSLQQENQSADTQLAMALAKLRWDPAATTAISFEPRGSARVFMRLKHKRRSVIMIRYSLEREENRLYAAHARFLKAIGCPVPAVLVDIPEKQFVVVEDLGDQSLQSLVVSASRLRIERYYRAVLRAAHQLHERGTQAARSQRLELVAPFSADLYRWEREFFVNQFLSSQLHVPAPERTIILRELEGVARNLLRVRPALVHRDLQSSNILFVRDKPFFIDFQGMRFGPAAYDVAALLCDPYADLSLDAQRKMLEYYNYTALAGEPITERLFWQAAVERLAQALGAYGRLCAQPETAWFRKYIPPALRMMQRALRQVGTCERLWAIVDNAVDNLAGRENNS